MANSYENLFKLLSSTLKVSCNESDIKYYNYGYKSNATEITINNLRQLLSA